MAHIPNSDYVQCQNGGYYVTGSRVSLDSVVYAFRRGESPQTILEHFPAIGSLAKIYGAIAFALDHPEEIDAYLAKQQHLWEQGQRENPPAMAEKVHRARQEGALRSR